MATVFAFGNCLRRNGPNATVALVPVPSSAKTFLPVSSAGSADTPIIVEMDPFSTVYIDALPIASMPSAITSTPLLFSICWPQVVPWASEVTMKHSCSLTGWPWMPPSDELMYLTVARAALLVHPADGDRGQAVVGRPGLASGVLDEVGHAAGCSAAGARGGRRGRR